MSKFHFSAKIYLILSVLFILSLRSEGVRAFPGNLDFNFGIAGIVSIDLGLAMGGSPTSESARGLALYPAGSPEAGKFILAGNTGNIEGTIAVARYNIDGSLDASFGTGGVVLSDLPDLSFARAVVLQPDDKIVVVGELGVLFAGNDSFFLRFCPNGSPDDGSNCGAPGFGTDGQVFLDTSGTNQDEGLEDVALQPDGKIIAAGSTSGTSPLDFVVVRLCSTGSLDNGSNCGGSGFGQGGIAIGDVSGESDEAFGLALQEDGKIVLVGRADSFGAGDLGLARFCPDGSLDDGANCGAGGFGTGGFVTTDLGTETDTLNKVAIQADGKIVAVGFARDAGDNDGTDIVVARYCPDGSLDDGSNCGSGGFANGGIINEGLDSNDFDDARSLQITSEQKILVGGGLRDPDQFFLNRYLEDGSPDASFGIDGEVYFDIDFTTGAEGLVVQSDGKIVLGGSGAVSGGNSNFVLLRYLGDSADLAAQVSVNPPSVEPGEPIVFSFSAVNPGLSSVFGVQITLPLPAGVTLVSAPACSGSTELNCDLGELVGGETSAPVEVRVSSLSEGVVALTATVHGEVVDPNPSNDQATGFALVVIAPTDGGEGGNNGGGGCQMISAPQGSNHRTYLGFGLALMMIFGSARWKRRHALRKP